MNLLGATLSIGLAWNSQKVLTNFNPDTQNGQCAATLGPTVSSAACSDVWFIGGTLAASGSITFDLTALTDHFGSSLTATGAYCIVVTASGASWTYSPGASNGFAWFLGGTSPTITGNSGDCFGYGSATTAGVVNSTNKTIKILNNSGSASLNYSIAVLLKTS
jgi:hypothetical protein